MIRPWLLRVLFFAVPLFLSCTPGGHPSVEVDEVERIQQHLAAVIGELRAVDVGHLSASQRQARAEAIGWLEVYRGQGIFPHNHVVPGQRVPVFVDPHGTPCAVGYLLLRSGEDALVEDVVRSDNLVRVPELAGESRLEAWLMSRGLTLAEAARIQPTYGHPPDGNFTEESDYAGVTVGLSILTAAASSYSLLTEPAADEEAWVETLNVATGLGHLAMLIIGNDADNRDPTWAKNVNAFGVVAATVAAVDRIVRRNRVRTRGEGPQASPLVRQDGLRTSVGVSIVY